MEENKEAAGQVKKLMEEVKRKEMELMKMAGLEIEIEER